MGKVGRGPLDAKRTVTPEEMFLWLKGIVEVLFSAQHIGNVEFAREPNPVMEEGWAVSIRLDGRPCGKMGVLSEAIRKKWRMVEPVAVAEIALSPLVVHIFDIPAAREVPAYPSVARDVAMIVDQNVTHEDILKVIRKSAPQELTAIKLFDIFMSKVVGETRKSVAYSLVYRSSERTLTDEDANRYHEEIKKALKSSLNAEIRES
jgi:phenylalanyl-tRNA synthetase beta chain